MTLFAFYKSMALLWTLAEGLILIYVRWGFLYLKRGEGTQKGFQWFCVMAFSLLIGIMFGGQSLLGPFIDLHRGHRLAVYQWALWNFLCTLWVTLEGVIMVYVVKLYKMVRSASRKRRPPWKKGDKGTARSTAHPDIPILIMVLFSIYLFYQIPLMAFIGKKGLDLHGIHRVSSFYIRICGIFWIVFEWIIAYTGIRTYYWLRHRGGRAQ